MTKSEAKQLATKALSQIPIGYLKGGLETMEAEPECVIMGQEIYDENTDKG